MQRRQRLWTAAVAGTLVLGGGALLLLHRTDHLVVTDELCIVAPTFAYDPASGLSPSAPREVPADARCPVCGMYPARQRNWAAQVIFADGAAQFLDSPLSLFHFLQHVERYAPGRHASDIVATYVSDQQSGQWLDADKAIYVHGSRLLGPMRAGNLPAFADRQQAQRFIEYMGGRARTAVSLRQQLPPELQQLASHDHGGSF